MKDVQNHSATKSFALNRVGISEVLKPACIQRPDKVVMLTARIDLAVDLPSSLKGAHLSRNMEVLTEIIDNSIRTPAESLESLCLRCAKGVLEKHEYATIAEVSMEAVYFLERGAKPSMESYLLFAKAVCSRSEKSRRFLGVEVSGMTACPCAMETLREKLIEAHGAREILTRLPVITHNQRNRVRIDLEIPEEEEIEADHLIEIGEKALSTPTYGILKRDNEAEVVLQAHRNPKFVEDVVRDALHLILQKYGHFPDEMQVRVCSESEESIHKHNAFAEKTTTIGELKKEFNSSL
ncbi:MAG: GTP cyclohydrolase MptA [Thermoplasmata archaeon]|nr:GTP cyclohydrolase MptA [Thermoplasmata archaeon]